MPSFFSQITEYPNQNERERHEIKNRAQEIRVAFDSKKQDAQVKLSSLTQEINEHLNELDAKQKAAITTLLQEASVAINRSNSCSRIEELLSIVTWADNVVLGKSWKQEQIFPLLAKEMEQWGGLFNSKLNRVGMGLGAIILGLAAVALSIYLAIQFGPLGEYSPTAFGLSFGVVLGLGSIIWGLTIIFGDHDYNLSSEIKEFTQCFEFNQCVESTEEAIGPVASP